jgi:hypothetical protein
VVLALVLAFGAAVVIIAMSDINGKPRCDDTAAIVAKARQNPGKKVRCFDGSAAKKTIVLGLGYVGGIIAALAALLALGFTVTGRRGRPVLMLTAAAIVLIGLSIGIGSI